MPKLIHFASVPGVNHSEHEQLNHASWWADVLEDVGIPCRGYPAYWPSRDSTLVDWLSTWLLPRTFERNVRIVERRLRHWEAQTRTCPYRLLIGHSWGSVLLHNARLINPLLWPIPTLLAGSPITHWWLGSRIALAGRVPPWTEEGPRPMLVSNPDDPITSFDFPLLPRQRAIPGGFNHLEIEVDDTDSSTRLLNFSEHAPELYLRHPDVVEWIREHCW